MKNNKRAKEEAQLSISLSDSVSNALHGYMRNLNGESCTRLHHLATEAVEKQVVAFSLRHCKGNVSAAAKLLGISRTTLNRKMNAHGVKK